MRAIPAAVLGVPVKSNQILCSLAELRTVPTPDASRAYYALSQFIVATHERNRIRYCEPPGGAREIASAVDAASRFTGTVQYNNWPLWEKVIGMPASGQTRLGPVLSRVAPLYEWAGYFEEGRRAQSSGRSDSHDNVCECIRVRLGCARPNRIDGAHCAHEA